MPDMRSVYSSHIDAIGYDAETESLHVQWSSGGASVYIGVPAPLAAEVLGSPSIGEALHLGVRGKFPHKTVRSS